STIGAACNVAAEEPKHIRIILARSVSAIPLWGIGPFAENAGFRVEYIPAGTNADMQRNLQSGIELGTLGYQSPAVMAEQNVANVKIIASCAKGLTSNRGRTSKENALADRQEAT